MDLILHLLSFSTIKKNTLTIISICFSIFCLVLKKETMVTRADTEKMFSTSNLLCTLAPKLRFF